MSESVFIATCVNPNCDQHGIPKPGDYELNQGETVLCGGETGEGPCNQPCEITTGNSEVSQ
jgi:hypothetical protein